MKANGKPDYGSSRSSKHAGIVKVDLENNFPTKNCGFSEMNNASEDSQNSPLNEQDTKTGNLVYTLELEGFKEASNAR